MLFHGIRPKEKRLESRAAGRSWVLAQSALGLNQLAGSRKRAPIVSSLALVELLVGGFDQFGAGTAVIRITCAE
jgi:hypothetical protein